MDWSIHYPNFAADDKEHVPHNNEDSEVKDDSAVQRSMRKSVEIADIGCGYGGLLFALSHRFPDTLILGEFDKIPVRKWKLRSNVSSHSKIAVFIYVYFFDIK